MATSKIYPDISSPPSVEGVVRGLRASFEKGITKPYEWRLRQLKRVLELITDCQEELVAALQKDLGRNKFNAGSELNSARKETEFVIQNLKSWMKARKTPTNPMCFPGSTYLVPEPLGVVLVISPWNYPAILLLEPLVGALAAGNCVVLKPSEVAENVADFFNRTIPKYMDPEAVKVVMGGADVASALLAETFDHIFYTGNGDVGRIVMRSAVKNLTPITLELGGKSPTLIAKDADLQLAARRIAWGKFANSGQTCVAPDYILVEEPVKEKLVDELKKVIVEFYGQDAYKSPDYERVINSRHTNRIRELIEPHKDKIVVGGQVDVENRFVAPTIILEPSVESDLMKNEIFGPVLPILGVNSISDAINFVTARPKPLALYIFTKDSSIVEKVTNNTSSGGLAVNDVILHILNNSLPFGGVGESGLGAYHGKYSFDTFSHYKGVLQSTTLDAPIRYPPYTENKLWWTKFLALQLKPSLVKKVMFTIFGPLVAYAIYWFYHNFQVSFSIQRLTNK